MMTLHIDPKELEKALAPLAGLPQQMRGALWQSVKRTLDTMKKELATAIQHNSFLPRKLINAAITKPQMYSSLRRGNKKWESDTIMGAVRVSSRNIPLDKFNLVPNRVTAQKGKSSGWAPAGFQIGPREPVRYRDKTNELSKGFVLRGKKGLLFFQGWLGKKRRYSVPAKTKRKYPAQGYRGAQLRRAASYTVQYFAAFDSTVEVVQSKAKERFERTLAHEVKYRLGKMK